LQSVGYGEERVTRQSDILSNDLEANVESLLIKQANDIEIHRTKNNDRDRTVIWCNPELWEAASMCVKYD